MAVCTKMLALAMSTAFSARADTMVIARNSAMAWLPGSVLIRRHPLPIVPYTSRALAQSRTRDAWHPDLPESTERSQRRPQGHGGQYGLSGLKVNAWQFLLSPRAAMERLSADKGLTALLT
jgi:hypothetical protein